MGSAQPVISRRSVLQGVGAAALGLSGAALLGCSGNPHAGAGATSQSSPVRSRGLPMSAPVVNGTIREGGIYWIAALRPDNHDPHRSTEQNEWSYIGESALDADPVSGALRPHLFTSWEIADHDGLSLVFKLHPKIFIHDKPPWDARQFTAEDAAWNLERLAGLHAERLNLSRTSFQGASLFANMTKARMIDPLTVKVTLSRPNSAFFSALTDTHAVMVPKEMDDIGWRDPLRFAGTGPWVTTEWTPDGAALYKRALGYSQFRAGEPHFECLRSLAEYADTAGQHAAFLVDKFQAVDVARPATLAAMRAARPDALLYSWTGRTSELIRFNMGYAPFRDARVRQAFHLAVDYEADAEAAFGPGGGWAYRAALHPGHPEAWETERVQGMVGYNPNSRQRDLATAQKLLAAAGFPDGAGIDFEMLASRTAVETRQRFAASMHRTFPRMQINTTAAAAESQAATAR